MAQMNWLDFGVIWTQIQDVFTFFSIVFPITM